MCDVVYLLGSMDPVSRESGYIELTLLLILIRVLLMLSMMLSHGS